MASTNSVISVETPTLCGKVLLRELGALSAVHLIATNREEIMRCKTCHHQVGKWVVTATSKHGEPAKLHKRPCGCECHVQDIEFITVGQVEAA